MITGKTYKKAAPLFLIVCMLASILGNVFSLQMPVHAAAKQSVKSMIVKKGTKDVTNKTITLTKGKTAKLTVETKPAKAKRSAKFTSSNKRIATVSSTGTVRAKRAGSARIRVTISGNYKKRSVWVKLSVREPDSQDQPQQGGADEQEKPAEPSKPATPSQPSEPDAPSQPSEPATPSQPSEPDAPSQPSDEPSLEKKVLVAYFSATGSTKRAAEYIRDAVRADIYEITPAQPYTSEDLNYSQDTSRVVQEHESGTEPDISGTVSNIGQYDVIFIGYPIWWHEAPNILHTFLKNHDLSGKTVIPFCTSASSGLGSSAANLQKYAPDAAWQAGMRFSSSVTKEAVEAWLKDIKY